MMLLIRGRPNKLNNYPTIIYNVISISSVFLEVQVCDKNMRFLSSYNTLFIIFADIHLYKQLDSRASIKDTPFYSGYQD